MTQAALKPDVGNDLAERIVDAVRDVIGPATRFLPLHEPEFRGNERDYVAECVETGWVSSVGSFVDRIEHDLADYTGASHVVAAANGTAALHMCLILAGVERGDEVLMPTITFVATANAVAYTGATPHMVDSEATTLGVDAAKLDAHLGEVAVIEGGRCVNRHTGATIRALVIMHAFGHPSDIAALADLAERWKIVLVEDAAESLGSFYHGRHTGNFGLVSAISFNGNKIVTTGGGGAIVTNDPELGRRAKHLTTTARLPAGWDYVHDEVGYNYRMPNLNAALGCGQLERLPDMLARKRVLAERYAAAFAKVDGIKFLSEPAGTSSNYWLNTIVLDPDQVGAHHAVLTALNAADYMSRPLWRPMHLLPMYAHCPRADQSVAEELARRVINIPSSPQLAD